MGGDGGSIPKRDDLVRTRTKPEQVSKSAELLARWKHCAITQQPLRPPIVCCELGRLYNKETLIEFLLDRSKLDCAAKFSYIRGLRDVKELQLTANPAYAVDASKAGGELLVSPYICPVTGLEMNGRYRFCYLLGCGCVFSDRALKEIKDSTCVNCGKSYTADDIIVINGTDEDQTELETRMEQRRALAKAKKGSKKRKAECSSAEGSASTAASASHSQELDKEASQVAAVQQPTLPSSSSTRSTMESRPKSAISKEKKVKTIQEDPSASEVFKSLFNTHKTAKQQQQAHWVTYNPQYF